ncbi:MAG TPA: hypothetical protein IAC65_00705 [Candidatus Aphodousia faecipullorum]|nr:hypothetical protein [Candidatus Aphodousia faecipullorum]
MHLEFLLNKKLFRTTAGVARLNAIWVSIAQRLHDLAHIPFQTKAYVGIVLFFSRGLLKKYEKKLAGIIWIGLIVLFFIGKYFCFRKIASHGSGAVIRTGYKTFADGGERAGARRR